MRIAVLAGLLALGCGPPATHFNATAKITNKYAESIFTLHATPRLPRNKLEVTYTGPIDKDVALFSNERIQGSGTAESPSFVCPRNAEMEFTLDATSLGDTSTFHGFVSLDETDTVMTLAYDYDLALGNFRVASGAE